MIYFCYNSNIMQKWEYLFVEVREWKKPYSINGQEIKDWWKKGPSVEVFSNQKGEEGWELISYFQSQGSSSFSMVFKRPKQ
jgi:hypothetical protein